MCALNASFCVKLSPQIVQTLLTVVAVVACVGWTAGELGAAELIFKTEASSFSLSWLSRSCTSLNPDGVATLLRMIPCLCTLGASWPGDSESFCLDSNILRGKLRRSTDSSISRVVHDPTPSYIDNNKEGKYVRLLFINCSSAFNTIDPTRLAGKLWD